MLIRATFDARGPVRHIVAFILAAHRVLSTCIMVFYDERALSNPLLTSSGTKSHGQVGW
ncbi:hypothetical protein DM02DRAFT_614574 [Periconia macrospinosa]|uniref:Uncharacterized protein n=1 Tax=Periconia macrospinosa TaxID=97972 RepID=A0A2V1DQ84_9PLEO|nr:hypothetical protein DM02DRAFT_614574 [Periconia macrospinosa]